MQALISIVSSQLRSRPLLVAAGTAATTAGLYYLYRRFGDRQRSPTATDISCSTEHEDPVQITEAEEVIYMCSPVFCGPVIAYTCPKLVLEQQIFKSSSSALWSPPTSPAWDHASSGPSGQPTTPPLSLPTSPSRSPSVTPPWTPPASSPSDMPATPPWSPPTSPPQAQPTDAWTEPTSPSESSSAPLAQSASPCNGLASDLQPELASLAQSEPATPPPPEPIAPSHSADEQSACEEVGDSVSTGTWQVPTLHAYLKPKGINNFSLRLAALRQAFSIILGNAENCNYVCLAGRRILGGLATLNLRYLTAFHKAYDSLLLVAQNPSYVGWIETELAQIGIQEFNFIDIVYELVLLGILGGARPQIFPRPGGFLCHLVNMLTSFSDVTMLRMPRADQYMFLVQNKMLLLLEEIFSMEEYVYEDPGHLAAVVWEYLQYHIQQLLDILEAT